MNLNKVFARHRTDFPNLDVSVYLRLEAKTKRIICQKLKIFNPRHLKIFEEVNRQFSEKFRFVKGIDATQCGLAPILGPSNCIRVFISRDVDDIELPVHFQGFPIIKIFERETPNYRFMIERENYKSSGTVEKASVAG